MRIVDHISEALGVIAGLMVFALIGVMLFEVVSRYGLNEPTRWAADLTYMLNGAIFMLAAAYCLRRGGHVRIDFLADRLPGRVQHAVNAVLLLFLVSPALAAISYVAVKRAWLSFQTGEVDPVSVFAPLIWPFHTAVAVGLCALTAQVLVEAARYAVMAAQPDG